MAALVAMASMETMAPFRPFSAPSRASSGGMAASSFALSATASCAEHQAGGGGEGGDEVERPCARAAVMAAARGLAVDRHQTGLLRPGFPHPVGEGRGEQRRVDAVHQDGEPALAWNAMLVGEVLAEKAEMRRAPGGDVFVVVAIGDTAADHQKENLRQRMQDPPHVARVLHLRKVVEQRGKPRLPGQGLGSQGHVAAPIKGRRIDLEKLPIVTCHMISEPCASVAPC